ncbi:MAG: hypothetical protein ACREX0_04075 [Noviherbaspirillum sp.]
MKTGTRDLYLAGYSYHGRRTYSSERLSEFNELTWGGGVGKSIRNKDGNEESLFAMLISDSHYKPQPMLGYSYEWIWRSGTPDGKWAQA